MQKDEIREFEQANQRNQRWPQVGQLLPWGYSKTKCELDLKSAQPTSRSCANELYGLPR